MVDREPVSLESSPKTVDDYVRVFAKELLMTEPNEREQVKPWLNYHWRNYVFSVLVKGLYDPDTTETHDVTHRTTAEALNEIYNEGLGAAEVDSPQHREFDAPFWSLLQEFLAADMEHPRNVPSDPLSVLEGLHKGDVYHKGLARPIS